MGWFTYGFQFLNTCLSSPYVADGVHWMESYGENTLYFHPGEGRDRLPRRARRVEAVGRAVEERVRGVAVERRELLRVGLPDEEGRLEGRGGGHREDGAVRGVERDDRATVRRPLVVCVGEADAVAQRLLGGPLEAHVECQPQRVPRARLLPRSPVRYIRSPAT